MPKVGMQPIRKLQLVEATLTSIERHGLHDTTIMKISQIAGVSTGIINHYFGGKQPLIEHTVLYLLEQLRTTLLDKTRGKCISAEERLDAIIESNFSGFHQSVAATKAWISFWEHSLHNDRFARLQRINNQRLISNLRYSFKQILGNADAHHAALRMAAMIDGFWLRSALSHHAQSDFEIAEQHCKAYARSLISAQTWSTEHNQRVSQFSLVSEQ
ncbi:transcriptional regulator BetI [Aestuariibacter sp. AA17]|uniref:HTH-type transcriptional regulator BetI n=1 Tax=Fluctibacter corallii TaxID=2984329 RepID=A0ABT3ACG4_9ALTE|nr:transcriptional regulator BetI [Aestuariibacter sp. AA17]MCV2886362.1 transcriptional regulator BetI [Aestuariibacter sp. AA17]